MEHPFLNLDAPILSSTKICYKSWGEGKDDATPEIGKRYAEVEGQPMIFTADNWDKFLELDKAKKFNRLSACSSLPKPVHKYWDDKFSQVKLNVQVEKELKSLDSLDDILKK